MTEWFDEVSPEIEFQLIAFLAGQEGVLERWQTLDFDPTHLIRVW